MSGGGLYPNISYQATKGVIVNMTSRARGEMGAERDSRERRRADLRPHRPHCGNPEGPGLGARIEAMTPMRKLAEPRDIAAAIAFLVSPAAAMITGHVLAVDGGFLAQ
jgi:NAD(P)-dependent dehydrogenase (short-subunit alcohol dehydrogenase family)